jgi:PIN domain nuclease of toxin-antitoxin system
MSAVLADTHVILWHLFEPHKLSPTANAILTAAIQAAAPIYVSAITPIEVRYLVERYRLPAHYLADLLAAIDDPATVIDSLDVTIDVARATEHIPRSVVPDMPDRIIAATALARNLPLVTADSRIRSAPIQTIW